MQTQTVDERVIN